MLLYDYKSNCWSSPTSEFIVRRESFFDCFSPCDVWKIWHLILRSYKWKDKVIFITDHDNKLKITRARLIGIKEGYYIFDNINP